MVNVLSKGAELKCNGSKQEIETANFKTTCSFHALTKWEETCPAISWHFRATIYSNEQIDTSHY
jgi:hypothetical protein